MKHDYAAYTDKINSRYADDERQVCLIGYNF